MEKAKKKEIKKSEKTYKYLVAVRLDGETEMFGFNIEGCRDAFIKEVKEKFPKAEIIKTVGHNGGLPDGRKETKTNKTSIQKRR